jgi:hypothetical protein
VVQAFGKSFHHTVGQYLHQYLVVLVVLGGKAVDMLPRPIDSYGKRPM